MNEKTELSRETVLRLAREAVNSGDGSELSGDAIERFAQLVFLEAASPSSKSTKKADDLHPQMALDYARRMKAYCESFNGRDWANVMLFGSVDAQNLAHALDNLTECAAMLMNMADAALASSSIKEDGERGEPQ